MIVRDDLPETPDWSNPPRADEPKVAVFTLASAELDPLGDN